MSQKMELTAEGSRDDVLTVTRNQSAHSVCVESGVPYIREKWVSSILHQCIASQYRYRSSAINNFFFSTCQAFINTAKEIYEKIQEGVFDINNEVHLYFSYECLTHGRCKQYGR